MNNDKIQPDLTFAKKVVETEASAIALMTEYMDASFVKAAAMIHQRTGSVVTTGIGKAGIVANKISATLASTGTHSHYLHPTEAVHGDLGRLRDDDIILAVSHGGASDEILRLTDHIKKQGLALIAITGHKDSPLAKYADVVLHIGQVEEACPLGLAPSTSTACMQAMGDALALTVMKMRDFSPNQFARFHPGGSLGRKLMKVHEAMTFRKDTNLPVAPDNLTVADVLHHVSHIKRRSGAVLLVDSKGILSGLFADSDLRRLLESGDSEGLHQRVSNVMTKRPTTISADALVSEATAIFAKKRIDELPVIDQDGRPVGLIDVQDVVAR